MTTSPKHPCASQQPTLLSENKFTNLRRALLAQHAPRPKSIDNLHIVFSCLADQSFTYSFIVHTTSFPVIFWQCLIQPLDVLILESNSSISCYTDWMDNVHSLHQHCIPPTHPRPQYLNVWHHMTLALRAERAVFLEDSPRRKQWKLVYCLLARYMRFCTFRCTRMEKNNICPSIQWVYFF